MAACDLEKLPLFCVRCWRISSSFNFALKLHHPVQLVCTCGEGFKRNINLIPSPPELRNRSSSASLDNSLDGGRIELQALGGAVCWGVIAGAGRDAVLWALVCPVTACDSLEFMTWKVWIFGLFVVCKVCKQYGMVGSSIFSTRLLKQSLLMKRHVLVASLYLCWAGKHHSAHSTLPLFPTAFEDAKHRGPPSSPGTFGHCQ